MIKDKYIEMYNKFISQLHNYAKAIRILAKGYLPISLVTSLKLKEIFASVKETLIKTTPDYDIVIKQLHLYYDIKLVTFSIDRKRNLIIQFLIFIQPYTQQPLFLYQLETVPVPVIDRNTKADTYTELQITKPYIVLKPETYINIRQQELTTCKKIGYEFYCKELFVVRHGSRHSCESVIYFDLDKGIIKLWILILLNKIDVNPTVLDGGNEIILANWPDDKQIIWTINNDIPIKILNHPYVLVNRSVLCNCGIKAENNFLQVSLAACYDADSNLVMYFTVNTACGNYIEQFHLTETLTFPILTDKTTSKHTLPIFLNNTIFNEALSFAPQTLQECISWYKEKKGIFNLKERYDVDIESPNKNFFTNNLIVDIIVFTATIILNLATMAILYLLCKDNKLRTPVAILALQQVKKVGTSAMKQDTNNACNCTPQFYII